MKSQADRHAPVSKVPQQKESNYTKRISSKALFNGGIEIIIEHAEQEYRLRITRQDKLILTK